MINDTTDRVETASAWTWIATFFVDARFVAWTFRID